MEAEAGFEPLDLLEPLDQGRQVLAGLKGSDSDEVPISFDEHFVSSSVGFEVGELSATERHDPCLDVEKTLDFVRVVLGRGEDKRSCVSQRAEGGPLDQTLRGRPELRIRQRQRVVHENCVLNSARHPHDGEWDVRVQENYPFDGCSMSLQASHVQREQESLVQKAARTRARDGHLVHDGSVRTSARPASDEHARIGAHLHRSRGR